MRTLTEIQKAYLFSCGIYDKWWGKTFDEYENDPQAKAQVLKVLKEARQFLDDGLGLNLHGDNGVGKTHLLMCAMMEMIFRYRFRVRVIPLSELVTLYKEALFNSEREQEYKVLLTCHILAIEEVGKEFSPGSDASKNLIVTALDYTLRYRVQTRRPVWITSNVRPAAIKDIYTNDISSMLKECSIPVKVVGADYREVILSKAKKRVE